MNKREYIEELLSELQRAEDLPEDIDVDYALIGTAGMGSRLAITDELFRKMFNGEKVERRNDIIFSARKHGTLFEAHIYGFEVSAKARSETVTMPPFAEAACEVTS